MKTYQPFYIKKVKTSVIEKFREQTRKRKVKDKTFTQGQLLEELLN